MANTVAATKRGQGKQKAGATKPALKGGTSKELTEKAVEHSRELRNGVPRNPGCTFSPNNLSALYYKIKDKKAELNETVLSIKENLSVEGKNDGSNGHGEIGINHSSVNEEETNLLRLECHSKEIDSLSEMETIIMGGRYKNICEKCGKRIPLARAMFVLGTRLCVQCGPKR